MKKQTDQKINLELICCELRYSHLAFSGLCFVLFYFKMRGFSFCFVCYKKIIIIKIQTNLIVTVILYERSIYVLQTSVLALDTIAPLLFFINFKIIVELPLLYTIVGRAKMLF